MKVNSRFRKLLEPGLIGHLEVRNRIVMAPMGVNFAGEDGCVTERFKNFYEERARGGVGLIVIGVNSVDYPRGKVNPRQIGISDDRFVPGLRELTEAVHRHGAKIAAQLHHGGRVSMAARAEGNQPVAPSPIPMARGEVPRELSVEEIARIVHRFAQAAERAKKAGYDGVEIHAGHGYLIAEFLSRYANKRQDEYGGRSLENRARLLLEVIRAIRQEVGNDYPVWCRLDGREFGLEDGITPEDARETARMAEEAGVDAVHVTGYGGSTDVNFTKMLVYEPGGLVSLAQGIKRVVNVPVIAVGRISPGLGEQVLRQGKADFIAMARPLIADPELPNKLASGSSREIRPCIYCYTCVSPIFLGEDVYCTVNAAAGREGDFRLESTEKAKKVTVVGGGPAGMEAARVAALKGHRVTLYERERRLGGSLVVASAVRRENEDFLNYLLTQVRMLPVEVRLGQEVTPEVIEGMNSDATILALGSGLVAPHIAGVDRRNVISVPELRQLMSGQTKGGIAKKLGWQRRLALYFASPLLRSFLSPSAIRRLSRFLLPVGKEVAIIGGNFIGCQLAEFLGERGKKVTILETQRRMAPEMPIPLRWITMDRLRQKGVAMLTEVRYEEITGGGVVISTREGDRQTIGADSIVLAVGVEPGVQPFQAIQGRVPQVYLAGDCADQRLLEGSIAGAARIASNI